MAGWVFCFWLRGLGKPEAGFVLLRFFSYGVVEGSANKAGTTDPVVTPSRKSNAKLKDSNSVYDGGPGIAQYRRHVQHLDLFVRRTNRF